MKKPVKTIQWGSENIKEIQIYPSLPSSNTFAKELVEIEGRTGVVVWTLKQTKGKGRRGRSWQSDDSSLTFSVLLQLSENFHQPILPLTTGLGLVQSLEPIAPGLKVKWPNDLLYGTKKAGGILAETKWDAGKRWVILGIGLNVNKSDTRFSVNAISLEEITNCRWSRLAILNLCLEGVEKGLALATESSKLSRLFRSYGNFLDRQIIIKQGNRQWSAVARDVLSDGRLVVEDEEGIRALMPDEISVRFPY